MTGFSAPTEAILLLCTAMVVQRQQQPGREVPLYSSLLPPDRSSLFRCLFVSLCLSLLFGGLGGRSFLGPITLVFASLDGLTNFL